MNYSEDELGDFQKIWEYIFHESIPIDEARRIADDVIHLYSLLGAPRDRQPQSEVDK